MRGATTRDDGTSVTAAQRGEQSGALALRRVCATYRERGRELPVLDCIDFRIEYGEFVTIIGPSGSGKSTLLDIVAGLIQPTAGEVLLDGAPRSTPDRLGRSSYMKQRDLLMPWRTVEQNAAVSLEAAGVPRRAARKRARARLAELQLDAFASAYPAQLSGGMRQRVAFVRTLLAGHSLLLLDEPFGALDALTRASMQDWLMDQIARGGETVALVTHDVEEAILLADRVIVLSARPATIVTIVTIAESRPRRRAFVASAEFLALKRTLLDALGMLS